MNKNTLLAGFGYAGDQSQIKILMPYWEHHKIPIVVMSPIDSPITSMGAHICREEGLRGYTGQRSLDRQWMQMRALLEFNDKDGKPFQWFLLNDSDSLVLTPELPAYLYEDQEMLWGNKVNDFRKPGESWQGLPPWPMDYHKGHELVAIQPPYFLSRNAMERMVKVASAIKMCPICPFIDWYMIQLADEAGINHKSFHACASCETTTANGLAVMSECIIKRGATFIHAIKTQSALDACVAAYKKSR